MEGLTEAAARYRLLPGAGPVRFISIGDAIDFGSTAYNTLSGGGGEDRWGSGQCDPAAHGVSPPADLVRALEADPGARTGLEQFMLSQMSHWGCVDEMRNSFATGSPRAAAAWAQFIITGGTNRDRSSDSEAVESRVQSILRAAGPTATTTTTTTQPTASGGGGGGIDVGSIVDDIYERFIKPGVDETRRRVEGGVAGAQAGAEAASQQNALGVSMPVIIAGLVAVVAVVWAINRG